MENEYRYDTDIPTIETHGVVHITQEDFASVILNKLNEDRKGPQLFCDVTINAEGCTFFAHKCVVGLASDFFKTMFTSKMKENYESKTNISNFDSKTMGTILDFIYSGKIVIDEENVYDMLNAAEFLQMQDLKELCGKFLRQNCNAQNCLIMWGFARGFNLETLTTICELFISTNYNDILQNEDFKQLSLEDFKVFLELRPSKIPEEVIYHSVIAWIHCYPKINTEHLNGILRFIDFKKLTKKFLKTVACDEKVIMQSKDCQMRLMNVLGDPGQRNANVAHNLIIIGGWPDEKKVIKYDVVTHSMTRLADLPLRHSWACSIVTKSTVYVIGGHAKGVSKSHQSVFSLRLNDRFLYFNWASLPPMINRRRNAGCALLNNRIYTCGGKAHDTMWLNSCEYFHIEKQQWREIPNMNVKRAEFGLVALGGLLYAVGGCNKPDSFLDSLECHKPETQIWTFLSPMKIPRAKFAAVVLKGEIYIIGGEGDISYLDSVEKYSPHTNTWSYVACLNHARYNLVACVMEEKIYVFGGLPSIEVYDPTRNEWSLVDNLEKKIGCTMVAG